MFEPQAPAPEGAGSTPEPPGWALGPVSAECLVELAAIDPRTLDPLTQVQFLRRVEAHLGWLESLRNSAMLAVAGVDGGEDDEGREEVAAALRVSPTSAHRRLRVARALATRLPGTRAALAAGAVSGLHAMVVAETTAELTDAQAGAVEATVLPRAGSQTVGQLRAATRRAAIGLAPLDATAAHQKAAAARRVQFWPGEDGMATMQAELPAYEAATIRLALDAMARADDRDLPMDARRTDALVNLAALALGSPQLPRRHRRPVQVHLVIDLPTLLGLADHPAELPGFGPLPAPVARRLAADGTWRRLVTDPVTGRLLDFGHTVYTPPQQLTDFILARDATCTFPGCTHPADSCDLDHTVPYDAGGPTSAANLRALCRRHHRLKTHHGWGIRAAPDGALTWTSPTGTRYQLPPHPVLT